MTQAGEVLSPSILLLFIPQTCNKVYEWFNDCDEVITASCTWGFNASDVGFYSLRVKETHADLFLISGMAATHFSHFQFIYFVLGKKFSVLRSSLGWDGRIKHLCKYQVLMVSWWLFYTLIIIRNRRLFFMFIIISQNIMPPIFF